MAFQLKRTTVNNAVQESKRDKPNYSATEAGTAKSMDRSSGEGSEEKILGSSDMKEQNSSDGMAEQKEVNTGEATKSGEKCAGDALAESEKSDEGESLSMDGKSLSGNMDKPILREDLKEAFKKFGTVRFVDFSMGDDSGYLRFEDPKAADEARVSAVLADEGGLIVKDHIVTVEALTGKAEKDYWNKIRGTPEKYKDNRSYKARAGKVTKVNGKRGRHSGSTDNVPNKAHKVKATA